MKTSIKTTVGIIAIAINLNLFTNKEMFAKNVNNIGGRNARKKSNF